MRWGYDYDGVLCETPPKSLKKWGRMNGEERRAHKAWLLSFYENSPQILKPEQESFIVITARKPEAREVSLKWLGNKLKDKEFKLYMLAESRSIENVLKFKSGVINDEKLTDYVEDNIKVVKGLRQMKLNCRIWLFKNGMMSL